MQQWGREWRWSARGLSKPATTHALPGAEVEQILSNLMALFARTQHLVIEIPNNRLDPSIFCGGLPWYGRPIRWLEKSALRVGLHKVEYQKAEPHEITSTPPPPLKGLL
jgi:hypothetical protein